MGGSMNTTLSSTGKVHSLGHQYEYIPKQAANYHTNQSEVRKSGDDVWCVVGASGETKNFKGVPMGAFAASDTFSPAWRRSM
ncbi:hypothetical protein CPB86DRAFT_749554 [Serendipita vermifera]|nr:hypothetical protein CPB86DRAFT_749554 [Serendipita vermifera]